MRRILKTIDLISEYTGRGARWLCVAIVLVLTCEVIMRYAFNSPTEWAHLTTMMLWGSIGLFGLAHTHLHHGHIRVDVFYDRLSPKGKAIIDVIFALIFDFALIAVFIYGSFFWMSRAWTGHEVMTQSFWYPPAGPFRTVMLIGWSLFGFQTIANFIRDFYVLIRGKPYD